MAPKTFYRFFFCYPIRLFALFGFWLLIANAVPLSFLGRALNESPAKDFLIISVLLFWYLVPFGLLSLIPGCSPWLKVVASVLVVAILMGYSILWGIGNAISGGGGRDGLVEAIFWPVDGLASAAKYVTTPIRKWHYIYNLADSSNGDEAARGVDSMMTEEQRQQSTLLQVALAKAMCSSNHADAANMLRGCAPIKHRALLQLLRGLEARGCGHRQVIAELVLELVREEHRRDPELVASLIRTIEATARRAGQALPAQQTKEEDDTAIGIRIPATLALIELAPKTPRLETLLSEGIQNGDAFSAYCLSVIIPNDRRAAAAYARFLSDPSPKVRSEWIDYAYAELDPTLFDMKAAVVRALSDPDAAVRSSAVVTLAKRPDGDAAAYSSLSELLRDRDAEVRKTAIEEFASILGKDFQASPRALWALVGALSDADPTIRPEAARAIATAKLKDPKLLMTLLAIIGKADTDSYVRETLVNGLLDSPIDDASVFGAVKRLLDSNVPKAQQGAIRLIESKKSLGLDVQLSLVKILGKAEGGDDESMERAVRALQRVSLYPKTKQALREVIQKNADDSSAAQLAQRVLAPGQNPDQE